MKSLTEGAARAERVANSNTEQLLEELEQERAPPAANASKQRRGRREQRGGAQGVQGAGGLQSATGTVSTSGEQEHSDDQAAGDSISTWNSARDRNDVTE
jgi:hypothetical protein